VVDVVVVYKIDRLSRSLMDFSKLVEVFDRSAVTFVSVTQSFNTTTSMGRLTLNVLLSFAQFEREVTAERIRDKIAASKAKGMWMGGVVPIGYRAEGRSLVPVPEEAALVRRIFERYLALGSVNALRAELNDDGIRTPERRHRNGRVSGGAAFWRGKLYAMLSNPLFIGRTRHRDKVHPGQHAAIVDSDPWNAVQLRLATNRRRRTPTRGSDEPSPLAGRLFDPDIARSEGADVGDVSRSLQLAFLAPDLVEAILNGTQPVALTSERLKRADLPLLWQDQRAALT